MAEVQSTTPAPKNGSAASPEAIEAARRTVEALKQQAEMSARNAEKTAEARRDAARANREILQRNVETTQEAMRAGLKAGSDGLEAMSQNLGWAFSGNRPNPEVAAKSAQNIRAVSEASTALARGAQQASQVWFDLLQHGVRANLDALGEITRCRTMQDVVALQSRVARENLERFIEGGQHIAQSTAQAISDAGQTIHHAARPAA